MVEAGDMRTDGIAGDSHVRITRKREILIGPRRVIPVCILASQYPDVVKELHKQIMLLDTYDERAGEFMQRMRQVPVNGREMEPAEKDLLRMLESGPRSLIHLTSGTRFPRYYLSFLYAWEDEGYLLRGGFTPTDAAHVLGLYSDWNGEASQLAAQLLARTAGLSVDELCRRVIAGTSDKIAREVLGKVLEDDHGLALDADDKVGHYLIDNALEAVDGASSLHCALKIDYHLVAIGAPVSTYMPEVARMLNTKLSIPEHCGLANAIGAVSGSVVQTVRLLIQPTEEGERVRLHTPTGVEEYANLDECLVAARELGRALATERVRLAGADEFELQVEQHDQRVQVASGWGDEIYLGSELIFTAAGRPGLVKREDVRRDS